MQGNDIGAFDRIGQATMFEGVLASPPAGTSKVKAKFYEGRGDWDNYLKLWKPNDLPLRSLIDSVNRLMIGTEVITFIHPDAVDPIYNWLSRKGVSTTVLYYKDANEYRVDLQYNRNVRVFYTGNTDDAFTIGMRATVVSPDRAWSI